MVDCHTASGLRYKVYMEKGVPKRTHFVLSETHEAWITMHKGRMWFHIIELKKTKRGPMFDKEKVGIFTLPGEQIGTFLETLQEVSVLAEEMQRSMEPSKDQNGKHGKRKADATCTDTNPVKRIKQQQLWTAGPSSKAP